VTYQALCQKFPYGKPTRARLIACEPDLDCPDVIKEVLAWLAPVVARHDLGVIPEPATNGPVA